MEISSEELKIIKDILKQMYVMSQREDWSESDAQFLICDGGDVYKEIFEQGL